MARPRQMSDEQILEGARACFVEHGAQVSTAHIASELGLSQAALFKRFHTKENLLISALMPPTDIPWISKVEAGPTDEPVPIQLEQIASEALAFMQALMPRIMVLKSANIDPAVTMARLPESPPRRALRALTSFFAALHWADRIRVSDPSVLAVQFLGSIHGRAFFKHMFNAVVGPADDAQFVESMVNNLWTGLSTAEAS